MKYGKVAAPVGALVLAAAPLFAQAFKLPKEPRERMFAILFLIALNPLFWGLFEQAGGSLNLYTDRFVDRAGVPASLFQSINPIYIILLAPLFAALWQALGRRGLEPSAPAKFGLALTQVGLGFLVFVWGAKAVGIGTMTPVALVFLIFDVETVFLFPWAVKLGQLGLFAVIEGIIFILILIVGLVYTWRKGMLEWA